MDRRTLFNSLRGRKARRSFLAPNYDFSPYDGVWGEEQAGHLLRRTTFGPTKANIRWSASQGLAGTLDELFKARPMPSPPVNATYSNDPNVPVGSTWIEAPYVEGREAKMQSYRQLSLTAWSLEQAFRTEISIREKLTLFWHNHFTMNDVLDPKFLYRHISLLRKHAWGNFRDLVKAVTIDPAMLIYLNGNRNKAGQPDENYARELLELFTIGKGPQVAPGDYTHYTEKDIREIAKALTGWKDYGFVLRSEDGSFGSNFIASRHDQSTKTLSHRFQGAQIVNSGAKEYEKVVDIIFNQDEVARFICRKLYRWFLYHRIDAGVETNIIQPMAARLIQDDYRIENALRALLRSRHFFDREHLGTMVKNPLDFIASAMKPLHVGISTGLRQRYHSYYMLSKYMERMQMDLFRLPEVAGWRAYYVDPVYYRDWVNASTLIERMDCTDSLAGTGIFPFKSDGKIMKVEVLPLIDEFDNPLDPNDLIEEMAYRLLPRPLSSEQLVALKDVLIPGLPDFEWTVEYRNHLENPSDKSLASAVEHKLQSLLKAMFHMAEFQLQ